MPDQGRHERAAAPMRMRKLGGRWQLVIENSADLEQVLVLDEALWVAMSAPVAALNCDRAFLDYVDTDHNGRIRADELKTAIAWLFRRLRNRERVGLQPPELRLQDLDASHAAGQKLRATAQRVLANLDAGGTGADARVTLEQVRDNQRIMANAAANGDGVIPAEAVDDRELADFVRDVAACMGTVSDVSGLRGVDRAALDTFLAEAQAHLRWLEAGRNPAIRVWGRETAAAFAACDALAPALERFFALCEACRVDERVAAVAWSLAPEADGMEQVSVLRDRLAAVPLARPVPEAVLDFSAPLNPVYRERVENFRELVLARLRPRGMERLDLAGWREVKSVFAAYAAWRAGKAGSRVEPLGEEKLRGYLRGNLPARLRTMIESDRAVAEELARMQDLEKLILYQALLPDLANDFVAFPHLYDPRRASMVQAGSLVLDGRRFMLTVKVTDRKAHKRIARKSHICLLYLEVNGSRAAAGPQGATARDERWEVAAAVTAGPTSTLWAGKRGIFYSPSGREYDALVVDVLENPVGLWEAVKQPFQRLAAFAGKQAERFTTSRYSEMEKRIDKSVTQTGKALDTQLRQAPPARSVPASNRARAGTVRDLLMSGSVAVAALGGTFALVTKTLSEVKTTTVLQVLAALVLIVAVPTLVVAMVKLRRRNLATLLDACGWAMNGKLVLGARAGRLFTLVPKPPARCLRRRPGVRRSHRGGLPDGAFWFWFLLLALALLALVMRAK